MTDGEEYIRQQYNDTINSADILPSDSKLDARMRQMFMLNISWFMQTLLDRKDRMSMYNGLEVRVPFCDHRIVEYAYNIPWSIKSLEGREKGIVREAMRVFCRTKFYGAKKAPIQRHTTRSI